MTKKRISVDIHSFSIAPEEDPWATGTERSTAWTVRQRSHLWRPPTDIYETEKAFVVMVEVAGMRQAQFTVTLERQVLAIRGLREDKAGPKAYHQMEIAFGEFVTEVEIPVPVEVGHIEATYTDGFLQVILPKARAKRMVVSN